jgi:hypothetical protein
MSASAPALARTTERLPHWSSTSHADARRDRCPAWLSPSLSSPRAIVFEAEVTSIGHISRRHHPTAPYPHLASTLVAAVKSP